MLGKVKSAVSSLHEVVRWTDGINSSPDMLGNVHLTNFGYWFESGCLRWRHVHVCHFPIGNQCISRQLLLDANDLAFVQVLCSGLS